MQAIQCPHCNKYTPRDHAYCLGCGESVHARKVVARAEESTATAESTVSENTASSTSTFACPRCGSENLSGNKKGFGLGKAVIGGVLTGGVGLLGGFIGSNKVLVTCMECAHSWEAGKK